MLGASSLWTHRDMHPGPPDVCACKHRGKSRGDPVGEMRKNWGARANILRERIGRGDVLKPNIDMAEKADRTAETLGGGSNSMHR